MRQLFSPPDTLCPGCGFSPLPAEAEVCPRCGEPFAFLPAHKKGHVGALAPGQRDHVELEPTLLGGGVTGAVTAHPLAATLLLGVGAGLWFLRVAGVLEAPADPEWFYAAVGLNLLAAGLLFHNLGPGRRLAQVAALAQLALLGVSSGGRLLEPGQLFFTVHALAQLAVLWGEVGPWRRWVGFSVGLVAAALACLGTSFP